MFVQKLQMHMVQTSKAKFINLGKLLGIEASLSPSAPPADVKATASKTK
ncbi:MAG: hypothetical protein LBP36_01835 [Oscillospiraceae bacterium]|jgi:hypothetical protein|nr:hypothetical protein [Oscillospiraceae bacterium]